MSEQEFQVAEGAVVLSLPVPPAGHYWSVYKGAFNIDHLALRKKGRFWDKTIDDRPLFFRDKNGVMNPADTLRKTADSIMEELNGYAEWEKYYGDYSPVK